MTFEGFDEPVSRRDHKATANLALSLAIGTWILASLCGASLRTPGNPPTNPDQRRGYYFARAVCGGFPALVALAAVVTGLVAMRDPAQRRQASGAVVVAGGYLLLMLGAAAYFALGVGRTPYAPPPPPGPPLTDVEVRAFATRIEATLAAGDPTFFDSRMDPAALVDRAFAGLTHDASVRREVMAGMRQNQPFGGEIVRSLAEGGGTYTLLHVGADGDRPVVLFRLLGQQGVNYHELTLRRGADGGVVYEDIHAFLGGFRMSETLRRFAEGKGASVDHVERMGDLLRGGKPAEVVAYHDRLPAGARDHKELLLLRVQAAQALGPVEHADALSRLERALPADPGVQLMLLDHHLERGDLARTLEILAMLELATHGDPFVVAMQGNVLRQKGDLIEAKARAQAAAAHEPTLALPHEVLLDVALAERDHAATAAVLERLEAEFGYDYGDLSAIEFDAFRGTPEHAAWLERRRHVHEGQ